jgi:hypothetical protein
MRFDITLRLYHGWRKGFEETHRRKALVTTVAETDFAAASPKPGIVYRPEVGFGDTLLTGLPIRLHQRLGCHLPNTLRHRDRSVDQWEEKMVDTAIASDLVYAASCDTDTWLIVVGDDDDLIPPVYVAESMRAEHNGRVVLIRDRDDTPFFKLTGVGVRP